VSFVSSVVNCFAAWRLPIRKSHAVVLAAWCGVLFLYGVAAGPPYRTESLRAIIGRECLHGNWLFPVLYGEPFLTKPPGHYAAIGLCSLPFGEVTIASARLPSVLAASLAVFLVYFLFRRAMGERVALLAALLLPTSVLWLDKVPSAEIDMTLVGWVTAALVCFHKALELECARRGGLFSPSPRWGEGSERSERVRGELSGSLSFPPSPGGEAPPPSPQRGEGHKPAVAHAPGSPVPRLLKDCPSATVAVIAMPTATGPVPVVFKRVNVRSWLDPLKNLVRRSQALRSWLNGHALRDRWLPTPRPLAVFHRYRGGLPAEGYVLTEMVPDAAPLRPAGRELSDRLARTLRAMHDRGVSHRDLKAPNILLANGTDPVLIDLVGVRTQVQLTVEKRAKELARLNASFVNDPALTQSDRLRFLLAYLASGPALGVDWKNWWELVSRATAAKVARNRRAGRVLG
jgi:hypothetical protein